MDYLDRVLDSIEREWSADPLGMWQHLNESDLFLVETPKHRHIFSVSKYNVGSKSFSVNFIYTVKADRFREYHNGEEQPLSSITGFPTTADMKKLDSNIHYLTYKSKQV